MNDALFSAMQQITMMINDVSSPEKMIRLKQIYQTELSANYLL